MLIGEADEEVRRGSLKGAGDSSLSLVVEAGVFSVGFEGVTGLGFSAPAAVANSSEDLADTGVFGLSARTGGNVIDFVGVGVLGFSASPICGLERLTDAALTAADLGGGCTGPLVEGELGDGMLIEEIRFSGTEGAEETRFSDSDAIDETRFSDVATIEDTRFSDAGVALAVVSDAPDFGLRLFGPLARLLVM